MNLVARLLVAIALVLVSASSWAQISYFTLIDTDNNAATGCTVTLPTAGSVMGIERRLTATISENAAPQVTQLSLESCVGNSFGAPVALPGAPYPVGLNNGVGGADVVEQAVLANNIAPPGQPLRLYFAAQGRTSDDLLGAAGSPLLFNLWSTGESVGIPTLSEWGLLGLILLLLVAVIRQRSRLPGSMVGILLVGMLVGTVWAAGFLLDGQVNDWQGVPAVGTDVADSAPNTDIRAAFAAREGGNAFFRIDVDNAQTPNQAPSFTKGGDQTVLEDAGAQTVPGWATAIEDGDLGAVQTLTFEVTNNTNPGLFSVAPAVDAATGNLTYTAVANANGAATITLVLKDDGGAAIGGVDTSTPPQTFVINVTPVNDAPSFTAGPNQTVNEDASAQTVNSWATAISAGPANEAGQTLTFNIGNSNPGLFSAVPAISPTGVLTYYFTRSELTGRGA